MQNRDIIECVVNNGFTDSKTIFHKIVNLYVTYDKFTEAYYVWNGQIFTESTDIVSDFNQLNVIEMLRVLATSDYKLQGYNDVQIQAVNSITNMMNWLLTYFNQLVNPEESFEVLTEVLSFIREHPTAMNQNFQYVNYLNYAYDLSYNKIVPHNRTSYATFKLPFDINQDKDLLTDYGKPLKLTEIDIYKYLYELFTDRKTLLIISGPDCTGKSSFLQLIQAIFQDYASFDPNVPAKIRLCDHGDELLNDVKNNPDKEFNFNNLAVVVEDVEAFPSGCFDGGQFSVFRCTLDTTISNRDRQNFTMETFTSLRALGGIHSVLARVSHQVAKIEDEYVDKFLSNLK